MRQALASNLCLACQYHSGEPFFRCPECGYGPADISGFPAYAPELASDNANFHADAFGKLRQIEDRHWWFRSRNRLLVAMLRRYFPRFKTLLEIGCGTGVVSKAILDEFPDRSLSGSEIHSEGLRFARERLESVSLFQADARKLPFDSAFDVICAFDVLEHIDEDQDVISEIYRALRPGGGLLVTVPQHMWLWSAEDENACHVRRYDAADLVGKIRRAGFEILRRTSFVSLLLPALIFRRIGRRGAKYVEMQEFDVSSSLDRLCYMISSFERGLIELGASFPSGGSLLVVARRPRTSDSEELAGPMS